MAGGFFFCVLPCRWGSTKCLGFSRSVGSAHIPTIVIVVVGMMWERSVGLATTSYVKCGRCVSATCVCVAGVDLLLMGGDAILC